MQLALARELSFTAAPMKKLLVALFALTAASFLGAADKDGQSCCQDEKPSCCCCCGGHDGKSADACASKDHAKKKAAKETAQPAGQ